jgi:hypothetical protein
MHEVLVLRPDRLYPDLAVNLLHSDVVERDNNNVKWQVVDIGPNIRHTHKHKDVVGGVVDSTYESHILPIG